MVDFSDEICWNIYPLGIRQNFDLELEFESVFDNHKLGEKRQNLSYNASEMCGLKLMDYYKKEVS